ncbi:MAG TPA: hypothetical protein PK156_42575 [Polyangium sp.]|nr:hypothetical protein [Polyangium sp.]
MLKLLAIDVREGWAFVEDDGKNLLIRSPYQHEDKRIVSRAVLNRAVQDQDFEPTDRDFSGWAELLQFVKQSVLADAKQRGLSLEGDVGDEWIAVAPPVFIEKFINRIEKDLLVAKDYVTAQALLQSILLRSPVMRSSAELFERVRHLSLAVEAKQKEWHDRREQNLEDYTGFKRLERSAKLEPSRRIGKSFRSQGSILPGVKTST